MNIESEKIVSITEVNQNFSRAVRLTERYGNVIIFKNNKPKFALYDIDQFPQIDMTDDEKIDFISARILKRHRAAFLELAK